MTAIVSRIENDDRDRWQREGRQDIIHILDNEDPVWVGDHLISGKTGRPLHGCPFLVPEKDLFSCSIYETRPMVCRSFIPGSSEICPQYKK